jgi:glycosyltransferase involved in cell wall biosynthesis
MLFVGRLEPSKRPLDAVAAMQSVIEALPWARGYVVGEGSLFGAANRAAASIGDGKITVLGRLTDEEVARQYRLAEVVLVPSDYEGLGMVALEAMAAGAAVVGYDVVGLRDTIGQRGLLVDHADVGALAEATRRLLTDSALRSELVQRAGEAVHSERSWTSCAARYNDLYRDVLTR